LGKEGVNSGNQDGGVNSLTGHLEVEAGWREVAERGVGISDLTVKIVDRKLISENPRGLSAKLAKSGPRVDLTKVQGPLCKIFE
jgi:hypothetical protein